MFMEPITKELEDAIDESKLNNSTIAFKTSQGITIHPDNIFLYGEVDLNNQNDIDFINKKDIMTSNIFEASCINSNFDYDKGTITSDDRGVFQFYNTWDKLLWFKFNYCLLGKPKRIVIYSINKLALDQYYRQRRVAKYGEHVYASIK